MKRMKSKELTPENIHVLHETVGVFGAKKNFAKHEFLVSTLMLFSDEEAMIILEGDPQDEPRHHGEGTLVLPGPLRSRQGAIKNLIDTGGFTTALMVGEYWGYPQETAKEDYERLLVNQGPPPSQHPDRIEGVFVTTMSPLHKVSLATTFEIDRSGEKPELVNPYTTDESEEDTIITGWLGELLPMGSKT